jgi:hypothetical protein
MSELCLFMFGVGVGVIGTVAYIALFCVEPPKHEGW